MIKEIIQFAGGYRLKAIKTMPAREGIAWHATLYLNGEKLGDVHDAGDGGMINNYVKKADYDALQEWASSKLTDKFEIAEMFLSCLADYTNSVAKIKKQAKTSTIFLLKDEDKDEHGIPVTYSRISSPFNEKIANAIRVKYGDNLETIVNEDLPLWNAKIAIKKKIQP